MTQFAYLTQLIIVTLAIGAVFGRKDKIYIIYVGAWFVVNAILTLRLGITGQLIFYSNDQQYYVDIIDSIKIQGLPYDFDWWLTASRWPYTIPAGLLSVAGIAPGLSAKIVSLCFFLACIRRVQLSIAPVTEKQLMGCLYFTALGAIGVLFSSLAQRETAMMFCVLVIFLGRSPTSRTLAMTCLFFLRQHLAIAILVALLISLLRSRYKFTHWSPFQAISVTIGGNLVGYALYSWGFSFLSGVSGVFGHRFGIEIVTRISSNYFGLQFVTASESSRDFSLGFLILSRILLSETVVIPLLFTLLAVTSRRFTTLGQSILLAFSIYVGLVTNTEFNSFRQNIPLIPVMGLVVVQHLFSRQNSPTPSIDSRET